MQHASHPDAVVIDGHHLTLDQLLLVARHQAPVALSGEAVERMQLSRRTVENILRTRRPAYGINTGFGDFSRVSIPEDDAAQLQNNLILSHCTGTGSPFPEDVVRAMLLLRANALCGGVSGIRPEIVQTMVDMLNAGVHPVVPEKGSLGASGDLAPLSHMALVLLGRGEAVYRGQRMPGADAMKQAGLPTYCLKAKEGLALINGTQAMLAVGALTLCDALDLSDKADIVASLTLEALTGLTSAFEERLHTIRPHPGQLETARRMRLLTQNSPLLAASQDLRVQDAYTLRCIPQVHGAVKDALAYVRQAVDIELNSVTDNPLVFSEDAAVISGGNFHGEPLALAFDMLGIALSELACISERRLERMVNAQLSNGLPPFLVQKGGLNSGFMIVQYAAASMVSENKVLAHPASVDSIPSSANQEDHVSMGTTAARKARLICENVYSTLALELMAACQGLDLRNQKPNAVHQAILAHVRQAVPYYDVDREIRIDIEAMNAIIRSPAIRDLAYTMVEGL